MAMRSETSFPRLLEHDQLKCDVIASSDLVGKQNEINLKKGLKALKLLKQKVLVTDGNVPL